jgi:hypothetical protein
MVGELDAGNPHVQFAEGAQETCGIAARLCLTLPQPLAIGQSPHGRKPVSPVRASQVQVVADDLFEELAPTEGPVEDSR